MCALNKICRGRHFKRPLFDLVILCHTRRGLITTGNSLHCKLKNSSQFSFVKANLLSENCASVETNNNRFHSIKMALNKLSIDKVDLTGKRVLIR